MSSSNAKGGKKFKDMTGAELHEWAFNHHGWLFGAFVALRDAIRKEALEEGESCCGSAKEHLVNECNTWKDMAEHNLAKFTESQKELLDLRLSWTEENARKSTLSSKLHAAEQELKKVEEYYARVDARRHELAGLLHDAKEQRDTFEELHHKAVATLRAAESALGEVRREGAREALLKFIQSCIEPTHNKPLFRSKEHMTAHHLACVFRDLEYPATDQPTKPAPQVLKMKPCRWCGDERSAGEYGVCNECRAIVRSVIKG